MSENTSLEQTGRRAPRWVIGACIGAGVLLFAVIGFSGGAAGAVSHASLNSQAEEFVEEHVSQLGCDRAKNRRIINAQYGTIGYDHQGTLRTALPEGRAPAVHAVIGLTCINDAAVTEEEIFQQVIVAVDTDADELRCSGIESITRYDVKSKKASGYLVDFDDSGNRNGVAVLRAVCDFQES